MSEFNLKDVRLAVSDDLDHFLNIFAMLHSEAKGHVLSENILKNIFLSGINDAGFFIGVIGDVGEPLKAFIILSVGRPWYSEELIINEYGTFVHPDYRKTDYFNQLVEFSKNVSNKLNLPLYVGIQHVERNEAKIRLYRKFFQECATQFKYLPKLQEK